jgi:hypothetical protein
MKLKFVTYTVQKVAGNRFPIDRTAEKGDESELFLLSRILHHSEEIREIPKR